MMRFEKKQADETQRQESQDGRDGIAEGSEIGLSDACFRVRGDDGMIGELQVSKGSVVWFPSDAKKGFKLGWFRFDKLMQDEGMKCEKRK